MAWLSGWTYRASITSTATEVDEDIGVYRVPLSAMDTDFWTNVNQTDARDIRVTTSDGSTEVPVEIVQFNATADTGAIFFKGTGSTTVDTVWYVYYGNAGAALPAITDTYGAENVWTDFEAVYHLTETGGTTALDSTANDNDLTSNGTMTSGDNVDGPTSDWPALDFDGTDDYLVSSDATIPAGYVTDGTYTQSTWVSVDVVTADQRVISTGHSTDFQALMWMDTGGSGDGWASSMKNSTSSQFSVGENDTNAAITTWYKYTTTWDGTTMRLYIDGAETNNVGVTSILDLSTTARFHLAALIQVPQYMNGQLAEARVASAARSANYLATTYSMENAPATFWTIGSEETGTDTGWTTATTVTDEGGGDVAWGGTLSDARVDNTSAATCATLKPDATNKLRVVNFPWATAIPSSGITIAGVEFRVRLLASAGSSTLLKEMAMFESAAIVSGTADQFDSSVAPTVAAFTTIGGATDLWGASSITKATCDSTTFGFQMHWDDNSTGADTLNVEYVEARVHWTVDSGATGPDLARGAFVVM